MAAGLSGCVLALVGECITVSIFQKNGDKGAAAGAVFFLFLHIAFYSTTMDATSYIYAAEIFPTPVRAKGIAISVSGLFVATIIFLEAAPTAFANIEWKYYTVFISVTTVMVVVILLYVPEVSATSFVFTSILTLSRPNDDLLKISVSSLATHHISLTWKM
jgi:hypothetical protein